MRLRRVVRNCGGSNLKAFVELDDGYIEEIDYTWIAKTASEAPVPEVWYQAVMAEAREADRRRRSSVKDIHDFIS